MGVKERKKREKNFRYQQIQQAAKKLFLHKSFTSTTMEDIAETAELSVGTLYQYFENKEELFASLNLKSLQYLTNRAKRIYSGNKLSVEDKILKFKDAMYKTYRNDPLLMRSTLHILLEDSFFRARKENTRNTNRLNQLNDVGKKLLGMMASVYEDGVREGRLIKGHGSAYADIIWSIFVGLVIWEEAKRRINPKKNYLKPTLDMAFDIFCKGIQK
jgi:AcrR family transcriptional regulator